MLASMLCTLIIWIMQLQLVLRLIQRMGSRHHKFDCDEILLVTAICSVIPHPLVLLPLASKSGAM